MNYRMGYSYYTLTGTSDIKWVSSAPARNPYDLVVDVTETEGSCLVSFTTQRYLYMGEDVQKLMQSYVSLLKILAGIPQCVCRIHFKQELKLNFPVHEDTASALTLRRSPPL